SLHHELVIARVRIHLLHYKIRDDDLVVGLTRDRSRWFVENADDLELLTGDQNRLAECGLTPKQGFVRVGPQHRDHHAPAILRLCEKASFAQIHLTRIRIMLVRTEETELEHVVALIASSYDPTLRSKNRADIFDRRTILLDRLRLLVG